MRLSWRATLSSSLPVSWKTPPSLIYLQSFKMCSNGPVFFMISQSWASQSLKAEITCIRLSRPPWYFQFSSNLASSKIWPNRKSSTYSKSSDLSRSQCSQFGQIFRKEWSMGSPTAHRCILIITCQKYSTTCGAWELCPRDPSLT